MKLYGFEDYKIVLTDEYVLEQHISSSVYTDYDKNAICFFSSTLNNKFDSYTRNFENSLYINHKELLNGAKKLYIHPSCSIPRSLVSVKFQKCLNPWLADAVILPKYNIGSVSSKRAAVFINDDAKIIVIMSVWGDDKYSLFFKQLPEDTKFKNILGNIPNCYECNPNDLFNAEFAYYGEIIRMDSKSFIFDILSNSIPLSKTVCEDSLQSALSSEDNKITLETLVSIKEMLDSSDNDTFSVAIKTLATLDYIHYSNSVKYILKNLYTYQWYNPASYSTLVEFMMKQLSGTTNKRRWPGNYSDTIYPQDLELLKELIGYYNPDSPDTSVQQLLYGMPFMRIDSNSYLTANLVHD